MKWFNLSEDAPDRLLFPQGFIHISDADEALRYVHDDHPCVLVEGGYAVKHRIMTPWWVRVLDGVELNEEMIPCVLDVRRRNEHLKTVLRKYGTIDIGEAKVRRENEWLVADFPQPYRLIAQVFPDRIDDVFAVPKTLEVLMAVIDAGLAAQENLEACL